MLSRTPDSPSHHRLPNQRWHIATSDTELAQKLAQVTGLPEVLAQVLINRGIESPAQAQIFLHPETEVLPSPMDEFPDLAMSVELLENAIASNHKIAICGDYDADGMTSTALLIRALRWLGGNVDYAIPSRMQEGYGINRRIVEDFHGEGVRLILTVDNGIAAYDPIARARELGLSVIVTDHHDIPEKLPPANAILNPKLIRETSPYRGVAGVGVAYILAISLAQQLGKAQALIAPLRELMTLGTIADLAPLTGVNRRWLKLGLRQLPNSKLAGIQALIQMSGVKTTNPDQPAPLEPSPVMRSHPKNAAAKSLKPDDIGFRLGPRINAVGRIGDPEIVIELLTTDDMGIALERAMQCEQINERRQQLCAQIETEAIAWVENNPLDFQQERVLVLVQPNWHHGVIGIVASRLVERYGVPVFIGTYEDEEGDRIRGSARSIPEFHVFEALQFCDDLLEKYGGHRAAGGFSFQAKNLNAFRRRLSEFACSCLKPEHLKPLIKIDAAVDLDQINHELYHQIDALQPCGIENREPVFWTPNVRVIEQRIIGKNHIKATFCQTGKALESRTAIAWRWGEYFPLPSRVDIAYQLKENHWNGNTTIELELVGVRLPETSENSAQSSVISEIKQSPAFTQIPNQQPLKNLTLDYPKPPKNNIKPIWKSVHSLAELLLSLEGRVLLYGFDQAVLPVTANNCEIERDRPKHPCPTFILWTLPPSVTHLQWLIASGHPREIYIANQLPTIPDPSQLRSHLQTHLQQFPTQPIKLLQLSQKWWVAPCTLVAALRELHYTCPDFPPTFSLDRELERVRRWYLYPAEKLAQLEWL